jgi:hypothetical protein
MCVVYFRVKMVLCVGLRALGLEEGQALRTDPEPECSLVLKQSLHGALHDGFYFLWTGHDHRAEGIIRMHNAGRDSRHQAL